MRLPRQCPLRHIAAGVPEFLIGRLIGKLLAMQPARIDCQPSDSVLVKAIRYLFSFRVMLATGLAVVCCLTVRDRFNDPDLWFHLRLGQVVWETHSIPVADLFSYTVNGHFWIAHEWLAELGMYWVYRFAGYTGLMICFSILSSLIPVLVYVLCYRWTQHAIASFLGGILCWFFATIGFAIRPQLLGYTFLALEILMLEMASVNKRWLWLLPPLFAVWVNCHGSFSFGMALLSVYWVCSFANGKWGMVIADPWEKESHKQIGIALVFCGAALLCNPVGIRLLLYPLNVAFQQTTGLQAVHEWMAPDPSSARGMGAIVSVIGILLASLLRRTELRLRELVLVALGFGLAMQHVRMLIVFGIVTAPVLCRVLAPVLGRDGKEDHPIANSIMITASLCVIALGFPNLAAIQQQIQKGNPVDAVDFIRRTHLRGPMLNEYVFGDYLTWALKEEKVFIDGRGDVYDWTGVFAEFGRWATLSEDPEILLNKYKVRFCLLAKGSPMAQVLPYMPEWSRVYTDDIAVIFVRAERN
jgi:hypothetical protein